MVNDAIDLSEALLDLFEYGEIDEGSDLDNCNAKSFASAGLLTTDTGIVLQFKSGAEFQLTIVRSK